MNATTAAELLRLPRRHPAEMRAIVSVAGWTQTLRRRGDTGPIRYGRSHTAPGVPAEDAVRVILAEARKVVAAHAPSISPAASPVESQTGGAL